MPRVALPEYSDWGDTLQWIRKENMPGSFPYTGGVFPFKRQDELPVRMFAGEGSAERTNKRYHFLSKDQDFNRLSVAFDSPACMEMTHKKDWIYSVKYVKVEYR